VSEVIAYGFQGTVRCETSLRIKRIAQDVIEEDVSVEAAMNRLIFASVKEDLPAMPISRPTTNPLSLAGAARASEG